MKPLDAQVIEQAQVWLEQQRAVWLCTVLSTYGSAPRGPGAMLVCLDTGEHCGSLSGGCVEEDFLQRIRERRMQPINRVVRYGAGGLAPTVALPCGGSLDVLVEYISADDDGRRHLATLAQAFCGAAVVTRTVPLETTERYVQPLNGGGARVQATATDVHIRLGALHRLLLAGLSPVAEYCASFALALGYEVIVCDPRSEVTAGFALAGVDVHEVLPAVFIAEGGCHAATAVVALTHDPRLDDLTLMEAVRTQAFYIGAMGSQRTSDKRFERLSRIGGLDAGTLQRIHAPIGLHLGSKTPAEIAMAVMADIVRVANGVEKGAL